MTTFCYKAYFKNVGKTEELFNLNITENFHMVTIWESSNLYMRWKLTVIALKKKGGKVQHIKGIDKIQILEDQHQNQ